MITMVRASPAAAQPAAPPPPAPSAPPSELVPPRLISSAEVAYPDGAHGDTVVRLVVTVARDGSVQVAQAVEGEEPFRSAAEAAARTWRFEPALRGTEPVAARIRFEVTFREPAPPESTPPQKGSTSPPAEPSTSAPSVAPPSKPVEVTIFGDRPPPPGVTSLTRAEVRQLPGAFGDPFRAIEALPGVTPIVSGIPFFYVRGAPPGNVGYFLDGIKVPYLYHVGLGPSVIHPGMVERVDLYAGGYPAQFGRFAGGIVAAETTDPRPELHGEGNIRLFDLGALTEAGFANGKGTALVAGRYSYTAALFSLIAKDITLNYRDYEARVTYDVTPHDRFTLFTFGAYDLLGQTQNNILNVLFGTEFYRLDTRYDHSFGAGSKLRAGVTLGLDRTKIPGQPRLAHDSQLNARLEASHEISSQVVVRGGTDLAIEGYRADVRPYSDPDDPQTQTFNSLFPARNDLALGGWTDLVLKFPGVELTPGVRTDLFQSGGASAVGVDPRISSRIAVADRVHVVHAIGLAHQPPSFIIPIPGLAIGSLQGGLQTSIQSSAGVEVDLPEATTAKVNVFDNVFLNMSDTLGVRQPNDENDFAGQRSLGSAIGAELYVHRKLTRRVGGFLSYTLSRSTRSVGREHFPSGFDRTHVANAAVAFNLGRNWRAGTRLVFYTGVPSQPRSNNGLIPPVRGASPPRDPIFYRVDLRFEKRWVYSPTLWLSFVAEIMNATLHKEVLLGETIGPITIPSLGFEAGF